MIRRTALKCLSALLVSVALGCSGNAPPPAAETTALKKIKVLLDWKAEPTYAGFFIAKQQGFFAKRGLDVEIEEGNGATVAAQLVGAGTYSIASCSGEATAIARAKGIPVRSLAVFYPNVPTVIYSRADTPIRTPQDLPGKRIGIINGSITLDEYRGMLTAQKIDRSKIKEVDVGFEVAPLLQKQVDGLMNYQELTPVELRLQGHDIVTMRFADYGLKAYSLNLISNDSAIAAQPEVLRAVVEATIEGYEFLRSKPEEAAAIFSKMFPERRPEYVKASIAEVAKLLGQGVIGTQTTQGWTDTLNTLSSLSLLAKPVAVSDVTAPGFLK
jgi:ABC-type nitrate/sulfonate/bicarbonate transport system substrate-binding protein